MKPLLRYITTCPYCHNRLNDEMRNGKEVKTCYSDICMLRYGGKSRVWEAYDYDNNGD